MPSSGAGDRSSSGSPMAEPCACGGMIEPETSIESAIADHQRTPRHEAWRAVSETGRPIGYEELIPRGFDLEVRKWMSAFRQAANEFVKE